MRLIFTSEGTLISRIVAFGARKIQKWSLKSLYSQHVTFRWILRAGGNIGSYFFENEAGAAVLVNGLRYRTMINQFFWPKLEDMDVDDVYSQQDGATYHTSSETICLLRGEFPDRVIYRNGDFNFVAGRQNRISPIFMKNGFFFIMKQLEIDFSMCRTNFVPRRVPVMSLWTVYITKLLSVWSRTE